MIAESSATETVVRNHLQAFLEQQGIDSIVRDYDEAALFDSEARIYRGKQEIHGFFGDFIGSLPAGGIDRFELRSLRVEGSVAYITWSVGTEIPLGHRHVRRGSRPDRCTDICHVHRAGSVGLPGPFAAIARWSG